MSFHVVSDPAEVREVMRRTEDFLPTNALTSVVPLAPAALRILSRARFALPPVLASATGAKHRQVRKLVAGFFTPAKVAAIGPQVRELTQVRTAETAELLQHGPADLADAVAKHIPPIIMAELTGIRCPDLDVLKRWSRDSLELFWGWPPEDRQPVLAESAAEFYGWLRGEVATSRGTGSLFGVLDAAGLTPSEICSLGYFLVIAGQETTAQLIGTSFYRALQEPGRWQQLGAGARAGAGAEAGSGADSRAPSGAKSFVRQVLATESSVHTWRRAVPRDTRLGGTELPAGAEILLELSGKHPPDTGGTAYSLAFGHGLHRCLGAKLAELETVLVLEETARALPAVRLTGPDPDWLRLLSFQTPLTVTVEQEEK
ncbi:cytochrome P450 [Arthrobacter crystallopoietes]|uniref:Cytochrome P450 n=1 Tax=Crystallibacter crystallopoietes TaxID=37928 RepID=A0A1H1AYG9_9MICC|nr:cytochrome P450 [Arthrobacter crystallopoietes]AUI51354.1 cytochrome [Arthrobacter crystallopoietes]SDQ44693.1 Cytochrome P450 [Arthrobacter crystallopoietes]